MQNQTNPRIFLEIAAYRDPELPLTISRALHQATHPERLTFGIVHQTGPETLHQLDPYRTNPQFRIIEFPWQNCRGVGEARALTESLHRGEEFILQIDAHMLFAKNWDTELLRQWHACHDPRAVLSTYPPRYQNLKNGAIALDVCEGYTTAILAPEKDLFRFKTQCIKVPPHQRHFPQRQLYLIGALQFFPGTLLSDTRYIRELSFCGEEVMRSLQLYTHGYNIYRPIGLGIYHNYERGPHKFWTDMLEGVSDDNPVNANSTSDTFNTATTNSTASASNTTNTNPANPTASSTPAPAPDPALAQVYHQLRHRSNQFVNQMLFGQPPAYLGTARPRAEFLSILRTAGAIS